MKVSIAAIVLAGVSPFAIAALPTGLSGAWYNPAQSGHGIHLEMLSGDAATGAWNVFDLAGNPVHLYFEGRVEGGKLVANAYAPKGMRFGTFAREGFGAPHWGSLVFDFADCDHATLAYRGDGPGGAGFGEGTIPLRRLTRIAGVPCSFGATTSAPAGAYEGSWKCAPASYPGPNFRLHAAVDRQGRLWATSAWTPGPTYVSAIPYPPLLTGSAPTTTPSGFEEAVVGRANTALTQQPLNHHPVPPTLTTVRFDTAPDGTVTVSASGIPGLFVDFTATRAPGPNVLDAPAPELHGRVFTYTARGQFFDVPRTIKFLGIDGSSVCFVSRSDANACEYSGRVTANDAGFAMFDVFLNNTPDQRHYYGKAWIRADTRELVIVAEGGDAGFGLVAKPLN